VQVAMTGPRVLELLGQYIAGFESADTTALEKVAGQGP
jgi:hypothetical protein